MVQEQVQIRDTLYDLLGTYGAKALVTLLANSIPNSPPWFWTLWRANFGYINAAPLADPKSVKEMALASTAPGSVDFYNALNHPFAQVVALGRGSITWSEDPPGIGTFISSIDFSYNGINTMWVGKVDNTPSTTIAGAYEYSNCIFNQWSPFSTGGSTIANQTFNFSGWILIHRYILPD